MIRMNQKATKGRGIMKDSFKQLIMPRKLTQTALVLTKKLSELIQESLLLSLRATRRTRTQLSSKT